MLILIIDWQFKVFFLMRILQMSEEGKLVDKSESSSFEDLASAAADEIEEARRAEAAIDSNKSSQKDEWQDLLGSGAILKKVSR